MAAASRTRRAMTADLQELIVDRPQWHLQSRRMIVQAPSVRAPQTPRMESGLNSNWMSTHLLTHLSHPLFSVRNPTSSGAQWRHRQRGGDQAGPSWQSAC